MQLTYQDKHRQRWATVVRRERRRLRLSQVTFGQLFGVSHAAVSDWENGKSSPSAEVTWYFYEQLLARVKHG